MTPEEFASTTHVAFLYAWYSFYGITALLSISALAFLIVTKRYKNTVLLLLTIAILVDCVTFIIFEYCNGKKDKITTFGIALSINTSSDEISHWIVSYAYLTVILEMEALLDKETHMSNFHKLDEITV